MIELRKDRHLKEGKDGDRKKDSAARRTYGIFKVDPKNAREIAESDDITYLDG